MHIFILVLLIQIFKKVRRIADLKQKHETFLETIRKADFIKKLTTEYFIYILMLDAWKLELQKQDVQEKQNNEKAHYTERDSTMLNIHDIHTLKKLK